MDQLYKLMEQQKSHLIVLKEMDDLSEDEKSSIMKTIKDINHLIVQKTGIDSTINSINVSN